MGALTFECVADDGVVMLNGVVYSKDSSVRPSLDRMGVIGGM